MNETKEDTLDLSPEDSYEDKIAGLNKVLVVHNKELIKVLGEKDYIVTSEDISDEVAEKEDYIISEIVTPITEEVAKDLDALFMLLQMTMYEDVKDIKTSLVSQKANIIELDIRGLHIHEQFDDIIVFKRIYKIRKAFISPYSAKSNS